MVKRFGQDEANPVRTPLPAGYHPEANSGTATPQERSYYQSIIGSLLYLTLGTRYDITHAVIMMSQFMVNPSKEHIQKALYIVKYVKSTINGKLTYNGFQNEGIIAYADADWAQDPIMRRSVSGNLVIMAGCPISWISRKQRTVALSSTEAEYMSMSDCSRQVMWIKSLFSELGYNIGPVDLMVDNKGAIFLAKNPAQEKRSKHIDIRYHYVRERVEEQDVLVKHVPTDEQLADILTKNLTWVKFKELRDQIGIEIPQ